MPLNILFMLLGASLMYVVGVVHNRTTSLPNLTAIYEPLACGWAEGAVSGQPAMQVFATVTLATKEDQPVEIIQAYLKGTRPSASLMSPLVAIKQSAVLQTLNFTVRPVVGQSGKPYIGRIVLVDKHGNKYKSPRLEFAYRGSAKEKASIQPESGVNVLAA